MTSTAAVAGTAAVEGTATVEGASAVAGTAACLLSHRVTVRYVSGGGRYSSRGGNSSCDR